MTWGILDLGIRDDLGILGDQDLLNEMEGTRRSDEYAPPIKVEE